jgi:hypothetical protein
MEGWAQSWAPRSRVSKEGGRGSCEGFVCWRHIWESLKQQAQKEGSQGHLRALVNSLRS